MFSLLELCFNSKASAQTVFIPNQVDIDTIVRNPLPIDSVYIRPIAIDSVFLDVDFIKVDQTVGILDNSVYLPDSINQNLIRMEYSKLKNIAYKQKFIRSMYGWLFVNPKAGMVNVLKTENTENRFKAFAGKIIRNIYIQVLPPFSDRHVEDFIYGNNSTYGDSWSERFANKFHMKTSEKLILRQMTIKSGMRVDPYELVENEIMLKDLVNIDEVSMFVMQDISDDIYVDLVVVCKDEFSWDGEVETNFTNNAFIELKNRNLFNHGHQLRYRIGYRWQKDIKWDQRAVYDVRNIWGSHVDLNVTYKYNYSERYLRANIERQFITTNTKYAGGVTGNRTYYANDLPDRWNIKGLDSLFNYSSLDVWFGRSIKMGQQYSYNRNIYITARYLLTKFNDRPAISLTDNHLYYNRQNIYLAGSFVKIKYYKANLIFDFGRTEYIPTGLYSSGIIGFEKSEYENYAYIGTEHKYTHFDKDKERVYSLYLAVASYLNHNGLSRGFVKVEGSHISNLLSLSNRTRFRFYNRITYIGGIRPYNTDYLYIEDRDIRGFDSDSLRGMQKLSASISTTFFLPFIIKGFRASFTTFVDGGLVADEMKSIFKSEMYWGVGVRLNLRNDNLIIKNVSFRLTLYPNVPVDGRNFQWKMTGRPYSEFYDYKVNKPQQVLYQ